MTRDYRMLDAGVRQLRNTALAWSQAARYEPPRISHDEGRYVVLWRDRVVHIDPMVFLVERDGMRIAFWEIMRVILDWNRRQFIADNSNERSLLLT